MASIKKDAILKLQAAFEAPEVTTRLQAAYKARVRQKQVSDEEAFNFVKNIVTGIITTVKEDPGKKSGKGYVYLWQCTARSIVTAALEAVTVGIPVDSRQLAYLVPYKGQAEYQLGYKGLVQKVQELYENADVRTFIVWPEDHFTYREKNERIEYEYEPAQPFRSDYENCAGCFCIISYTMNGQQRERGERIDHDELMLIRSKAKQDFIWKEWFGEKVKVATLRRACKLPSVRNEDAAYLERLMNREFNMLLPSPEEKKTGLAALQDAVSEEINKKPSEGKFGTPKKDETSLTPETTEIDEEEHNPEDGGEIIENEDNAPEPEESGWDGVLNIGKKAEKKEWESIEHAYRYLHKVMSNHKSKSSRLKLIHDNPDFINAAIKAGTGEKWVTELHKLASEGKTEPTEKEKADA